MHVYVPLLPCGAMQCMQAAAGGAGAPLVSRVPVGAKPPRLHDASAYRGPPPEELRGSQVVARFDGPLMTLGEAQVRSDQGERGLVC
jgi:hypothetical protein